MTDLDVPYINEAFECSGVSPRQLDLLLAEGWRHFGTQFFRYSYAFYDLDLRLVMPMRIRTANFSLSKKQRRVLRDNRDVTIRIGPVAITDECADLFERHRWRFKTGIPDSLYDFLSGDPSVPCTSQEIDVRIGDRLAAKSYFDIGERTVSAVYAMFEPDLAPRSLGIFTMLKEIEYAITSGKEFYYQGYAYEGSSFYDYKKRFRGSEYFDWRGAWREYAADAEATTNDADHNGPVLI
jgi:arginine-tRNA-protein transferase